MNKSNNISKLKSNDLVLSDTEQNTMLEILHDGVTAYELAKEKTDQIEDFIQLLRSKPKV
jgi:hypothetical protein